MEGSYMTIFRYLFFIVIALTFVSALPYSSHSKDIPFEYTYTNEVNGKSVEGDGNLDLLCVGPWSRTSKLTKISPSLDNVDKEFYKAEVTIASPYGKWTCCTYLDESGAKIGCEVDPNLILAKEEFHLYKDDKKIRITQFLNALTIDKDSDDNLENVEGEISAFAALGDDNKRPNRDRDSFTFNFGPNPGDVAVTITLDEDSESGHIGEEATLILRDGNSTIDSITDALPIQISTVLPSDGDYKLIVEQHGIPQDLRFRGNYFLTIEPEADLIEEIRPTNDVEH